MVETTKFIAYLLIHSKTIFKYSCAKADKSSTSERNRANRHNSTSLVLQDNQKQTVLIILLKPVE